MVDSTTYPEKDNYARSIQDLPMMYLIYSQDWYIFYRKELAIAYDDNES